MHFWIWLSIAGIFIVLEILTMSLIFISLALAAIVGSVASAVWSDSVIQWIGFSLAAVLTLGILRPFVKKYLFKKSGDSRTGVAALIGEKALTLTEVNSTSGTINLRNETWTARSNSAPVASGTSVQVLRIDGAVAIIERWEG